MISQQYQAILTSITSSAHLPPSSLDSAARQNLREDVLLKYKAVDGKGWTWCLVTGRFWPPLPDTNAPHVRACHIFQRKWGITEWVRIVWVLSIVHIIPRMTEASVQVVFVAMALSCACSGKYIRPGVSDGLHLSVAH